MIKNEKYIKILKSMISCINYGDYYSVKELSNMELEEMKKNEKETIKKIPKNKNIKKNKQKPLENWSSEELKELIESYSEFILKEIEETDNIKKLQKEAISIQEFIDKI